MTGLDSENINPVRNLWAESMIFETWNEFTFYNYELNPCFTNHDSFNTVQ